MFSKTSDKGHTTPVKNATGKGFFVNMKSL